MYTFAKNIIATYSAMRIYGELTFFQLITLGVYNSSTRFRPSGCHYFLQILCRIKMVFPSFFYCEHLFPSSPLFSLSLLVSCFLFFFLVCLFVFLPISTNKDWNTKGALLHLIIHPKSQSVMVTPKKCKFMQLYEHHFGVSSTLKRCSFTPTWCKFVFMPCN